MEDKRKYPRLNWSVIVRWEKTADDSPGGTIPGGGVTKDISAGGVRLILREGIKVGDILELEIGLGGGRDIKAKGRVAWIEKFQISGWQDETGYEGGVEFVGMDDATRQEIGRFVMQSRKGTA